MKKLSKRFLAILFTMVLVVSSFTACSSKPKDTTETTKTPDTTKTEATKTPEASGGTITIGQIVTSLTGDAAMYGDDIVNAAQMAADEVNAAGGVNGKNIEIVYLDDQASPQIALQSAQQLINETKPLVILGPDWSGNTMASMAVIAEAGIPQIVSSKSRKITHGDVDSIFRVVASSHMVGSTLASVAKEKGYKKVAIWYTNSEYGLGGGEGAKRACEELGLEVVAYETHNVGDNDFTAQIMNVINSGADCIIDYSIQVEGAKSLKQMRELGCDLPVLGGDAFITPDFAKLVGDEYMEGVIATSAFVPVDPSETPQAFVENYKKIFGTIPDDHAAPYYDSVKILAKVIGEVGEDKEAITEALRNVKGYEGVQGDYTTDEWGNMIHGCKVVEYKSGAWNYVKTMPAIADFAD